MDGTYQQKRNEDAGRLPFSRAFALAGFSPTDADRWRRAGWTDPTEASRWRPLERWWPPDVLRSIAEAGATPDDVERVIQRRPDLGPTELGRRAAAYAGLPDREIDLRERILENLHRGASA